MRLISTVWQTVRWRKLLFWYASLSMLVWISWYRNRHVDPELIISIVGQVSMTVLFLFILMGVWSNAIHRYKEGFPLTWIFSFVVTDLRVFDDDLRLQQIKDWCSEMCDGKWRHCRQGYFTFKKREDAVAFKLRYCG